ncbi:hypothetical protein, partial [Klebsiella pneumoniae]|uniref:hypothetical protein n=1 Tax=Klebsiella pneumoniae TaxID=573 RepID=UPI0027306216
LWILTNIYAPCTTDGKMDFLDWFKRVHMLDYFKWLIVEDFNLIFSLKNGNKPGGMCRKC